MITNNYIKKYEMSSVPGKLASNDAHPSVAPILYVYEVSTPPIDLKLIIIDGCHLLYDRCKRDLFYL